VGVFKVRVQWEDAEALTRLLSPLAEKVAAKVSENE
jgi:hypothetical protein